jgi:hypothetical protein
LALDINTLCMSVKDTLQAWDLYDAEIGPHGFRPTMREYVVRVERIDTPPTGVFDYVFVGCMELRYTVTLRPEAISLDDRLLDREATGGPDVPEGFAWAVASASSSEEGVRLTTTSDRARHWASQLRVPMHEITIGTNVFDLTLVFHDLHVEPVAAAASGPHDV